MATYRNDPDRPDSEPPYRAPPSEAPPHGTPHGTPYGTPGGGYPPPGPPVRPDNRPLLVAAVAALVALVAVLGYYLLVYVPDRDARAESPPPPSVAVQTDRPPGALSDGGGFRPSVIEDEPLGRDPADDRPRRGPARDDLAGTPGLEQPPRRTPLPAPDEPQADEPQAESEPRVDAPPVARPAAPRGARREVVDFVEDYFDRQSGGSVDAAMRLYAAHVRYYDRGRVGAEAVEADKVAYVARFPERRYALAGPVRVVATGTSGVTTVRADYTFAVGGGAGGDRSGRAYVELDLVPAGPTFVIQGERGDVY